MKVGNRVYMEIGSWCSGCVLKLIRIDGNLEGYW